MARMGCGFLDEKTGKKVYLQRCFKCGKENYGPMVASGCCAWCGFDANKDVVLKARMTEQWTFDRLAVYQQEVPA